jgi:hypothetical protein
VQSIAPNAQKRSGMPNDLLPGKEKVELNRDIKKTEM